MTRVRSIVIGIGSFATEEPVRLTGFGSRRRSNLRHGLILRASAASLTASTSSIVRQRFENLNTLTRRVPGEMPIRPRWSSSFSDGDTDLRAMW